MLVIVSETVKGSQKYILVIDLNLCVTIFLTIAPTFVTNIHLVAYTIE